MRNPATGALLSRVPESDSAAVERAIAAARTAQQDWAKKPANERAGYLRAIASKIRQNAERLARVITEEQGKIQSLALVEVNFTADYMDYMAEWARRIEGEIITSDRPGENIFLFRKPLGVVAGILPWNFPFFLIARKMAPALVTGNTIVIKPSEETPNNCFEFAKLVAETDLPNGVFNVVCGSGKWAASAASRVVVSDGADDDRSAGTDTTSGGRQSGPIIPSSASATAQRSTLISWRTLPGHA